jgi:hypothetical protein
VDHQKCSCMNKNIATLNINTYNCSIVNKMFFIICAMDLCDVFHNAKFLLSILVGAQNSIYNWILIQNNSINKLISCKLEKKIIN